MALRPYLVGPAPHHQHTHTIILLHGRDSVADEFATELFESEASVPAGRPRTLIDLLPTVRWVFPFAPMLPSARFGVPISQWFDIWSVQELSDQRELQQPGLRLSTETFMHVITEEEDIVGRENVFLGGISQGFATAVAAFFIGGEGLAGLIGMSSWMPEIEPATITFAPERIPVLFPSEPEVEGPEVETGIRSTRKTPVFLAHNADDDVVPLRNGVMLRDALRARGDLDVEWHEYGDGGHWFNEPQGMDDLVGFLKIAGVPCQPQSL